MLSYKGNNYTSFPKGSGTIKEEDTERRWEPEVGNIWREVVLSGHDRTRILFFPKCLWLHTQNLDKSKPAEAPAWLGRGSWSPFSNQEAVSHWWLPWEGCVVFFRDVIAERALGFWGRAFLCLPLCWVFQLLQELPGTVFFHHPSPRGYSIQLFR